MCGGLKLCLVVLCSLEAFFLSFQIRCQVERNLPLPNRLSFSWYLSQVWFRMFECGLIFLWYTGRTHNLAKSESSLISLRYLFVHRVNVNDSHSSACIPPLPWLVFM